MSLRWIPLALCLAVVAILCMVGGAGYRFGQYLAERDAPVRQANAGA